MEKLLGNRSRVFSSGMCEGWTQKSLQSQPPTTFLRVSSRFLLRRKSHAGLLWRGRCEEQGPLYVTCAHAAMIVGGVFNLTDIAPWSNIRWDLNCFAVWFTGSNEKPDVGGTYSPCAVS